MKKFIATIIVVFGFGVAWPAVAPAKAEAYLHLENATDIARGWWNYNYDGFSRRSYRRFSDSRVDILGQGWRNGTFGCRWMIVRGSDFSKYVVWHPDSSFTPGCGGV